MGRLGPHHLPLSFPVLASPQEPACTRPCSSRHESFRNVSDDPGREGLTCFVDQRQGDDTHHDVLLFLPQKTGCRRPSPSGRPPRRQPHLRHQIHLGSMRRNAPSDESGGCLAKPPGFRSGVTAGLCPGAQSPGLACTSPHRGATGSGEESPSVPVGSSPPASSVLPPEWSAFDQQGSGRTAKTQAKALCCLRL